MNGTTGRRAALFLSFLLSQIVLLLILRMPTVPDGTSWLKAFRDYFSIDQLSYAGIASTVAAGNNALVEPFTETGHSYYPSLWYRIIGWLAAASGQSVPTMWTVAGYLLLAGSVAFIGYLGYRISDLAWAPALVGPALAIGTLSIALHDYWYTTLESHAVLWGPFGSLYALNSEVAGFALVGAALAMILRVAQGPPQSPRARIAWLTASALLLGLTANIHTYAFFMGAAVAFSWVGFLGLLRSRSRILAAASALLVGLTFALGPVVAERLGALPVYGLLIAGTLPGIGWIARREFRTLALPAVAFLLAASPQVAIVVVGILAKDTFLAYRQGGSGLLGVPLDMAVIAALPIGALWLFNLSVQRTRRSNAVLAALAALVFAGTMLTFNEVWGFGQEPYRMWTDSVVLAALLLAPITAWSIAQLRREPRAATPVPVLVCGALAIALIGVSLLDVGGYRTFVQASGVIPFDSPRYVALGAVAAPADGLLTAGPCIDPQELKIVSRQPVAYYNRGIAWPANKGEIDAVLDASRTGIFNPDAMRAAKVRYLVTDSACANQWQVAGTMGIVEAGTADYADESGAGTLTLWRIA